MPTTARIGTASSVLDAGYSHGCFQFTLVGYHLGRRLILIDGLADPILLLNGQRASGALSRSRAMFLNSAYALPGLGAKLGHQTNQDNHAPQPSIRMAVYFVKCGETTQKGSLTQALFVAQLSELGQPLQNLENSLEGAPRHMTITLCAGSLPSRFGQRRDVGAKPDGRCQSGTLIL